MRLIDADALIAWTDNYYDSEKFTVGHFANMVKDIPTIEERKVGKWIDQKGGGCCCSECGRYALDEVNGNFIHVAAKSNYCPNCGADMREEQDK